MFRQRKYRNGQTARSLFLKIWLAALLRARIAEPKVITPTRPMYINAMIVALPVADRSGVMPVLSPTVPMADVASKRI